jgi:hypothetical protein
LARGAIREALLHFILIARDVDCHLPSEQAHYLPQVQLQSIREALRLPMLAADGVAQPFLLDNVSNAITITYDWPEAKESKTRITAVARAEHSVIQLLPGLALEQINLNSILLSNALERVQVSINALSSSC